MNVKIEEKGARNELANPGGDVNDPNNFALYCHCGFAMGLLGQFTPNKDGVRTVLCARDDHHTSSGRVILTVTKSGQIGLIDATDAILNTIFKKKDEERKSA